MIVAIPYGESPQQALQANPGAEFTDLRDYISHKLGRPSEALEAESHERFLMVEEEALRDLVVMSRITGVCRIVRLGPGTLDNPECRRLVSEAI